jgi:hypothetical protein
VLRIWGWGGEREREIWEGGIITWLERSLMGNWYFVSCDARLPLNLWMMKMRIVPAAPFPPTTK